MKSTPRFFSKQWVCALKKGFTLVEVLAVVAIIAILATLTLNISKAVSTRQAQARANGDMSAIAGAMELYKQTYGDYLLMTAAASFSSDLRSVSSSVFVIKLPKAIMGDYNIILPPGAGSTAYIDENSVASVSTARRAFADPTIFRYNNNTNSYSPTTTLAIMDPWNNPYIYIYKNSISSPTAATYGVWKCAWRNPSFVLMSLGPDGVTTTSRTANANLPTATPSVRLTGIFPEDYRTSGTTTASTRSDNIIYGRPN